jgi:hypothetical protein
MILVVSLLLGSTFTFAKAQILEQQKVISVLM